MKNTNRMILLLGLMAFLANGDNYAAAPLLLNIATDLNLTVETAAISVTAYMLAFGAFTLLFGPLSDRFGKVRVINIAAFGTAIFSILGGFAYNLTSLVVFRAVNGAFAAGIFPVTLALVGQSFDDSSRHKALGKVMGMMFLGAATATIVGGVLAFFGSWRLVYIVYGVGELILAILMMIMLEKDAPVVSKLNYIAAYKEPLSNFKFMRLVLTIFLVGYGVFGSFTYSGKLIQGITGYTVLGVGLILSLFGVGTVLGGRVAPKVKQKLDSKYFFVTGIMGAAALLALALSKNIFVLAVGLFFFGVAFIFFQSTLVATVQSILPRTKGTAMSMASLNIFVGGAVGTSINANVISSLGISKIYLISAVLLFAVGILTTAFLSEGKKAAVPVENKA